MFDSDFLKRADEAAVLEYLAGLAKSYVPEWRADFSGQDIGASLVKLYAHMLAGNALRVKKLPDKVSAQLGDILSIQPLPANPAQSAVEFSTLGAEQVFLPRGTKLSAKSADGETLTFETLYGITVVSAKIERVIFSSNSLGKILYAGKGNSISLYGKAPGTVPDAVLTVEHPFLFNINENSKLWISFDGVAPAHLAVLSDPRRFEWSLSDESGMTRKISATSFASENSLLLTPQNDDMTEVGACVSLICKSLQPVFEEIGATAIYIGSNAENVEPEQIWRDDTMLEEKRVYPFGKRLSPMCEFRIACDEVFTQKGADITMRFRLEYESCSEDLPEEQKREYKLIMKAKAPVPPPVRVFAHEVSLACWNGTGWKPIKTSPAITRIFNGEKSGEIELCFTCPEDIARIQIGAAGRNWLRLRLMRADGYYLQGSVHISPVISQLRFSYRYKQKTKRPAKVRVLREMRETDITAGLKSNGYSGLFSPLSLDGDRLLVGLDSKPAGEVVNLYFDIENPREYIWLEAEYSGPSGFRKLHMDDYTDGFSASNALVFSAPPDFSAFEIYGENLYWILFRLRPRNKNPQEIKIRGVYLNTVGVEGKRTANAEIFYTDELVAQSELRLSSGGLLHAEVWVDETTSLSEHEKVKLREEAPEKVSEEHGTGASPRFWVLWEETRDFKAHNSQDRCYKLDRVSGVVRFPDGIHGRKPPTDEGHAIKIIPASSSGSGGNVPKHSITQPLEQLDFIGSVDNIINACGGYDAQTPETLLQYACSHIRSGNRIVTAQDMLDAIRFSCGEIAKLKLICDSGAILLFVLPYDFENALHVFPNIEKRIRGILAKNCYAHWWDLSVRLPDFAEIIVEATVVSAGDALNEEEAVRRRLNDFLHPITGGFGRAGWEIGVLPRREQILSAIQSVCPRASVELLRISVGSKTTGQYFDLNDTANTKSTSAVPGKYNLTWANSKWKQ